MDTQNQNGKNMEHMNLSSIKPYTVLAGMVALHFIAMYVLMYSMANYFSNIYNNLNQIYMAAIMTSPMIVMEVMLMKKMYHNKKINYWIIGISTSLFILFFTFIRVQTAISDKQFLRSMIPHHAGAILMCRQASIQDTEIKELCDQIISSQQSEIDQMKKILDRLN